MNVWRTCGTYIQWNIKHKKEWNGAIFSNKDGPRHHHIKQNKSEREIPYDISYMWNLTDYTNEHIYQAKTDSQREQAMVSKGKKGQRREGLGVWVSRFKLLFRG